MAYKKPGGTIARADNMKALAMFGQAMPAIKPAFDSDDKDTVHYGLPDQKRRDWNDTEEELASYLEVDGNIGSHLEAKPENITLPLARMNIETHPQGFSPSILTSNKGLYSRTCTSHAIAKCVCALFPSDGLLAQNIADCINQIFKDIEGTYPDEYNGKSIKVTKQDIPGSFFLNVLKVGIKDVKPNEINQFMIWYEHPKDVHHSIYVKSCEGNCFICIDSYGDDKHQIILKEWVHQAYQVGALWMPDEDVKEPSIPELTLIDVQRIALKLDRRDSWYDLGMTYIEQFGRMEKSDVENLRLCIRGGGNPAENFLENLGMRKYQYTVYEFRKLAEKLQRMDIYRAMQDWSEGLLIEIADKNRKTLVGLLNKGMIFSAGWKRFAAELGYSIDEIDNIGSSIKMPGKYSPSEELLNSLRRKHPEMKMFCLRTLLQLIGRNDIFNLVNEICQEHKERKMKNIADIPK